MTYCAWLLFTFILLCIDSSNGAFKEEGTMRIQGYLRSGAERDTIESRFIDPSQSYYKGINKQTADGLCHWIENSFEAAGIIGFNVIRGCSLKLIEKGAFDDNMVTLELTIANQNFGFYADGCIGQDTIQSMIKVLDADPVKGDYVFVEQWGMDITYAGATSYEKYLYITADFVGGYVEYVGDEKFEDLNKKTNDYMKKVLPNVKINHDKSHIIRFFKDNSSETSKVGVVYQLATESNDWYDCLKYTTVKNILKKINEHSAVNGIRMVNAKPSSPSDFLGEYVNSIEGTSKSN